MVTRIRVDAEGRTREECERHLDAVFHLLRQNQNMFVYTGSGSVNTGTSHYLLPAETEFVEEVYESQISDYGAIHWKGRRILRFIEADDETR